MAQLTVSRLMEKILRNMEAVGGGASGSRLGALLGGDPGIGKTTFIKDLSVFTGIEAIIIEVPHVAEEHVINIPFLVYNKDGNGSQSTGRTSGKVVGTVPDKPAEKESLGTFDVVLADSNLFSKFKNAKPISDAELLKQVNEKFPANLVAMWEELDGTKDKIPDLVANVRKSVNAILFLDEFYRKTDVRIRNIMRGFLDKQIGNNRIPASIFLIYASNLIDEDKDALDDMLEHEEFWEYDFPLPNQKDWFAWFIAKYEKPENRDQIQLNQTILKKFQDELKDEDISFNDAATSIRTSPRRWEQILLTINASLPASSFEDAQSLVTTVKNSFGFLKEDSAEMEYSSLGDKVLSAVVDLIKETSPGIEITARNVAPKEEWAGVLSHQISLAKKIGKHKSYIPVLSGAPGLGKTQMATEIAMDHNLLLITINVGRLERDDVIGLPIPGERRNVGTKDEGMETKFSVPSLYTQIRKQVQEQRDDFKQDIADDEEETGISPEEAIKKFDAQEWRYLIFLDELSRGTSQVFNGLRRVILEKNFGPSGNDDKTMLELPRGSILMGAMNPTGEGTEKLTSHLRDVVDIIPTAGDWKKSLAYFETSNVGAGDAYKDAAIKVLDKFAKKFMSQKEEDSGLGNEFMLNIGGLNLYVSSRRYEDIFGHLARDLEYETKKVFKDDTIKADQAKTAIDEAVAETLTEGLKNVFTKEQIHDIGDLEQKIEMWLNDQPLTFYGQILRRSANKDSLSQVLGNYLDGTTEMTLMVKDARIENANKALTDAQVIKEIEATINNVLTSNDDVQKYIIDKPTKSIEKDKFQLKHGNEDVSLLEAWIAANVFTLYLRGFDYTRLKNVAIEGMLKTTKNVIAKRLDSGEIGEEMGDDALDEVVKMTRRMSKVHKSLKDDE